MKATHIFPARTSNQITKEYYGVLVGQINRGTCSKNVTKLIDKQGNETYHLTSVR